jgi:lipoate-protein ligase A
MIFQNQVWHLLKSGPASPAFNMAMDEVLLESSLSRNKPVLRFYSWSEPAFSFGYFQKYAEIKLATTGETVVRRPTGGGVVPHLSDWTYSVVIPPGHEWHRLTAKDSYRRIHEWIQKAFAKLNVVTALADCCRKDRSGQCFIGYEQYDLLWNQQKIAGAAQRRTRNGLLIQGSIQPSLLSLGCEAWQKAMCDVATENGAEWRLFQLSLAEEQAQSLAAQKYSQPAYTQKR